MEDAEDEQTQPTAMEMGYLGSLEPSPCDVASEMLIAQLGATGSAYKRGTRKAFKHLVSEIYSPPRITEELRQRPRRWLLPGFALDITVADPDGGQPWDFSRPEKRDKARAIRRQQKPYMLIGSPECKAFCTWQRLSEARPPDVGRMRRLKVEAQVHMDFVASLYLEQLQDGLYCLHEHPRFASSWELPCIEELLKVDGVNIVRGDQCQCGAQASHGPTRGSPILKPTGFMSNSSKVLEALSRRCEGRNGRCTRPNGGQHVVLEGKLAREAAKYPRELCRAVPKGTAAQPREDRRLHQGCFGIQAVDEEDQVAKNAYGEKQGYSGRFVDDISKQILKDEWVIEARMKELEYFTQKGRVAQSPPGTRATDHRTTTDNGSVGRCQQGRRAKPKVPISPCGQADQGPRQKRPDVLCSRSALRGPTHSPEPCSNNGRRPQARLESQLNDAHTDQLCGYLEGVFQRKDRPL